MSDKMPLFENEEVERLKQRIRELESINADLYKALRAYMLLAGTPTPIEDMGKAALAKARGEG